jgi:DNA-binding NarL/FixJ family response regulator
LTGRSFPPSARVLVADHAEARRGVCAALEEDDAVIVCAEAGNAEHAITEANRTQPDACLVGWDLPGGGVTAIRGIFEVAPSSSVVALACNENFDDLLAALRAGAIGYVLGGATSDALRRVVRAVLEQEAAVPRSLVRDLLLELRATMLGHGSMSSREAQVLGMLRRGHSTAEIARRLRVSPVTVRRHISDLAHKLGVDGRAGLIRAELTPQLLKRHRDDREGEGREAERGVSQRA